MNNNSIKITLYRKGGFEKPEYSISIYDDGKVIYEGLNNVKIKSKIETSISEDDVILILEELKSSKLFSINQKYSVDEGLNRSFTKITIQIPELQGEVKTKTVIHYDDDPLISNSLKIFFVISVRMIVFLLDLMPCSEPIVINPNVFNFFTCVEMVG